MRTALEREAGEVLVFDLVASRLVLAARFGATPVRVDDVDPVTFVRERTGGRGVDRVIEAVGSSPATRSAAELVRAGGTIAAVGVHSEPHLALSPGEPRKKTAPPKPGAADRRRDSRPRAALHVLEQAGSCAASGETG